MHISIIDNYLIILFTRKFRKCNQESDKNSKDKSMKVNEEAKEKNNENMGRSHQELFITICFENV